MKVYVLSVIFSADKQHNKPYLLTSANNNELLPIIEIEKVQYIYKEIFHKLSSIFIPDSIKIQSECSYSFIGIQNELSVRYAIDHYDFIKNDDLIITYGGILLKYKCLKNFKWSEYNLQKQHNGYSKDMTLNLLLDYVIKRSEV